MSKFYVVAEFIDCHSGKRKYPGDDIEASGERVEELKKAGVIGSEIIETDKEQEEQEESDESLLKSVGGGYYLLPDGQKVHGKKAALEALSKAGD
jgi:hypothetical protein